MKNLFIALGLLSFALTANAQNQITDKYGKGITLLGKDSTFYMKANTRIQGRYDYERNDNSSSDAEVQDVAYIRRARIKFGGWVVNPNIKYKIEHDVLNGVTYDAVIKYRFYKKLEIWAGQTKLPGNRERVISSQRMQFVDRSLLNTVFTLDRDAGLQLRNSHKIGNMVFREMLCVSQGEGLNDKTKRAIGHEYTGRFEFLPFGKFASKGDYFASDLKREQKPKLAIGLTYDYNQNQDQSRKVKGNTLAETRNVMSIQADFMFKYRGFSAMGEYANMDVAGTRMDMNGDFWQAGEGVNLHAGYLFKNNVEIAARYANYIPFSNMVGVSGFNRENNYTVGVSKYVVGHFLKVQSDLTFEEQLTAPGVWTNNLIYRLQFEVAF